MSTTTETTRSARGGAAMEQSAGAGGLDPAPKDPYIYGSDETVLLDLRELRELEAADQAGKAARTAKDATKYYGAAPGAELAERPDAETLLYAHGGTAIPLERVREVCHDLRQPVAAILMLASAAEMRPDVPDRVKAVLQEIMTQTEDISSTVRQFLDDAKRGVDGLGDPVPVNVAGLATEAVERWSATFTGRIDLATGEDPLHVTVDPVLFKRALGNVLSNGTRAAGNGGQVQVTVRRFLTDAGERAVIEVDDSGPGFGNIPSGHGLGLAVVRRTVEAAGGSIEFADGPLGGALVRLVLPVTPLRQLSAEDELAATFQGGISLADLADELAASGFHSALVSEGHSFATRISALPEQLAIGDADERFGMSNDLFREKAAELAAAGKDSGMTVWDREVAAPTGDEDYATPVWVRTAHDTEPVAAASYETGRTDAEHALADGDEGFWFSGRGTKTAEAPANRGYDPRRIAREALASQAAAGDSADTEPTADGADLLDHADCADQPSAGTAVRGHAQADVEFDIESATAPVMAITPGRQDSAVAAITLPSRTNLTHPVRVPASALRPVASVQLSLLPGGAF